MVSKLAIFSQRCEIHLIFSCVYLYFVVHSGHSQRQFTLTLTGFFLFSLFALPFISAFHATELIIYSFIINACVLCCAPVTALALSPCTQINYWKIKGGGEHGPGAQDRPRFNDGW